MALIIGDSVANVLDGTSDADEISGLGGNDTLRGVGGSDTLTGGAGADSLVGGDGDDTYLVDEAGDLVIESADEGTDLVQASVSYVLGANQENLTLTGATAIDGTGNELANVILGNDAANTLHGMGGADALMGGGGNDKLVFDAIDTLIDGGAGGDRLKIAGSGSSLDLTVIANDVITGIERVSLIGSGGNTLVLAEEDLVDLSDTSDRLLVRGTAGDRVEVDGVWGQISNVILGNETYARYVHGAATLWVDTDIDRSGIDTAVSVIALSGLNGANGFRLDGADVYDHSGHSVASAGDVNGDGFDDLIVGAPLAEDTGPPQPGETYVVFGKASGFASSMDLAALDGANGFCLKGIDHADRSGISVATAGDVNGDGFDDVLIGARWAEPSGDSYEEHAGESYIVFGRASGFASSLDLATLDGTDGVVFNGIDAFDESGYSVASAGDVNGDGFDDVIIGAHGADRGRHTDAGESYVVFGKASGFASSIDLAALNGANGFRLDGVDRFDHSGISVASAGDVNGDGFDDVIIGAHNGSSSEDLSTGESYVIFGKASGFASSLDLASLDGVNGFRLDGIDAYDHSGRSVASAGDVNGDGFDDLIIGAPYADPGESEGYVVFGKADGFTPTLNLASLDGANGFRFNGIVSANLTPDLSVASAGDINGDGFDDLVFGARTSGQAGETYVLFGKAGGFASSIALPSLDGMNGFRLDGVDADDNSGSSAAAAGDVNGDGFDDLIIGAPTAGPGGNLYAGESYVVLGGDFAGAVTHLGTRGANSLTGTSAAETFVSGQGSDTITGGGGADVFNAGAGNDLIRVLSNVFRDVDGGSGTDILAILGAGRTLDLTALANNKLSGIERIDLTGTGDNTVILSMRDLFDLSDTTNQLRVDGNVGDTVELVGTWHDGGVSGAFHAYRQGAATILIDTDIFVT